MILVHGSATEPMGPDIRGSEIARVLQGRLEVSTAPETLLTGPGPRRALPPTRRSMLAEAIRQDAVMAPWIPPFLFAPLLARGIALISDLYDPIEFELKSAEELRLAQQELRLLESLTAIQLRFSTFLTCGSERQRADLTRRASLVRAGPAPQILVIPFGLPDTPPPVRSGHRLRSSLGLSDDDFVILWWGSLWRWFDPVSAVRAVVELARKHPRAKLVFTSGTPPNAHTLRHVEVERARELARELGVLNRVVFFLDSWIPYAERHEYLQDADVGLTLHADPEESKHAVRARYLDYLWCGLPCVLSAGDELADRLGEAGVATLVPKGDVSAVVLALEALLADERRGLAVNAARELAPRFRWQCVVEPLARAIEEASPSPSARNSARAAAATAAYYLLRGRTRVG